MTNRNGSGLIWLIVIVGVIITVGFIVGIFVGRNTHVISTPIHATPVTPVTTHSSTTTSSTPVGP